MLFQSLIRPLGLMDSGKPLAVMALGFSALILSGVPAMAQTNLGPNAGAVQQHMLRPGGMPHSQMVDLFYGPIKPQDAGLPPKGYERPVIIQDGLINGKIMNPTQPLKPAKPTGNP